MAKNIRHQLTINASAEIIYKAITTEEGLKNWWTTNVSATSSEKGGELIFGFEASYKKKMRVLISDPHHKVKWYCVVAHPEWVGTIISFDIIKKNENEAIVKFAHDGWRNETDMYALCNHHWGRYIQSLEQYCINGKGMPYKGDH